MKKDIGILTWFDHDNYGGSLQAYSLQYILKQFGYSSEFIDYKSKKTIKSYVRKNLKYFLHYVPFLLPKKYHKFIKSKFRKFEHDFLDITKEIYTKDNIEDANDKFKGFICGSDQIWAPNVFDSIHFLSFVDDKPKLAYAPSIGLNRIPKELKDKYSSLIHDLDSVSIREKKGSQIINDICNIEAKVVVDPCFLLNKKYWDNFAKDPHLNEDYIFVYLLGANEKHINEVKKLASKLDCKIISLSRYEIEGEERQLGDPYAGPKEFLGYIKNAKSIVTDSFHGTTFSLIFNKDFYAYERFSDNNPINQNSRIYNILNKADINERLIKFNKPINYKTSDIDYKKVNLNLDQEINKSLEYLKNNLSKYI